MFTNFNMPTLNQLTRQFFHRVTGDLFLAKIIDSTGKRLPLPRSGFVFITGDSGSGKTRLMNQIIKKRPRTNFGVYGIARDLYSDHKNCSMRYTVRTLNEPIDWFSVRDKLNEDIFWGNDIVLDEATIYINDDSIAILKTVFSRPMKNRVFFVTQLTHALLKQYPHPLLLFGGPEIQLQRLTPNDSNT